MKALLVSTLTLAVVWSTPAFGQDAPYKFKTADIPIRFSFLGQTRDDILRFVDVNNQGVVIGNTFVGDGFEADIKHGKKHSGAGLIIDANNQLSELRCPGDRLETDSTWLAAINNVNQIVGSCTDGVSPNQRSVGFVRDPSGRFTLLTFPGADGTMAFGINDRGDVVGQYWGFAFGAALNRFHGFLWKDGLYTTIDHPDPERLATKLLGINTAGQIIGSYLHHRPGSPEINDYDSEPAFFYDSGRFTLLEFPGAKAPSLCCDPTTTPTDINNQGQVIGTTYGPDGRAKFFLYADRQYRAIAGFPDNVTAGENWGVNDGGDLTGTYIQKIPCATCGYPSGPGFEFVRHAFVATAKKAKGLDSRVTFSNVR